MIMKNLFRKSFCILLALVMLLGLLPEQKVVKAADLPSLFSVTLDQENRYLNVKCSIPLYGDAAGTTGIDKDDFTLTFYQNGGGVTNASIRWIDNASHLSTKGGEKEFYFVIDLVNGPPTGAEKFIITTKDNAIFDSEGVAIPGGLSSAEIHLHVNPSQSFATGYPKLGEPQAIGSKKVEFLVKVSEDGAVSYVILPDGASAPSAQQIKNHTDSNDNSPISWAAFLASPGYEVPILSNLPDHITNYDVYFVAEAGNNNFSEVKKLDITTPPGSTPVPENICEINGIKYSNLTDAIDSIHNNNPVIIKLLKDINHTESISVTSKNITFDLNGYNLTVTSDIAGSYALFVGNGSVNYIGRGQFNVSGRGYGIQAFQGGNATVTNVWTDSCISAFGAWADDGGKIVINGNVSSIDVGAQASGLGSSVVITGTVFAENGDGVKAYAEGVITVGSNVCGNYGGVVSSKGKLVISGNVVGSIIGVSADSGGSAVIDGTITTAGDYISINGTSKTINDRTTPTTKEGYRTYADGTSTVWVKEVPQLPITYTINFNSMGGSAVSSQNVAEGGTITSPVTSRSGYNFEGWYKDSGYTTLWNFASDRVIENITLYAKWSLVGGSNDGNIGDGNNGSGNTGSGSGTVVSPDPTQGWVTDENGNLLYYIEGKIATGWNYINNNWYYFYDNGILAVNTKVDDYEVDENGIRLSKYKDDVEKITISPLKKTLYIGGTTGKTTSVKVTLPDKILQAVKDGLIDYKISFRSSNTKVAKVSQTGKITGYGKGNAIIKATITVDGMTRSFTSKITVKAAYITITKQKTTLKVGEKYTFAVKCFGYKEEDVTYQAMKSKIKIGKMTGKAKAVSKGTDYIIIRCGKITKKIKITIK